MTDDDLDRRILDALLADGRASRRTIAQELDVPLTTVSDRLDALEEDGVVDGYGPRLDYAALGYDVTAVFQLEVRSDALSEVVNHLRDDEQLTNIYEVTGRYDVVGIGKFASTRGLDARVRELLTNPAVEKTTTSVCLSAVRENGQFVPDADDA